MLYSLTLYSSIAMEVKAITAICPRIKINQIKKPILQNSFTFLSLMQEYMNWNKLNERLNRVFAFATLFANFISEIYSLQYSLFFSKLIIKLLIIDRIFLKPKPFFHLNYWYYNNNETNNYN